MVLGEYLMTLEITNHGENAVNKIVHICMTSMLLLKKAN